MPEPTVTRDTPEAPTREEAPWAKRAIVVIHGIGEQRRGNTLDGLVAGLRRHGGITSEGRVPEAKPFGEPPAPEAVRMRRGDTTADVYEVYWAPLAANKTTARSVLLWLFKASFIPGSKLKPPSKKTVWDIVAAVLALGLLGLLSLYGLMSLGNLAAQVACGNDDSVKCELAEAERTIRGEEITFEKLDQIKAIGGAVVGSLRLTDRPLKELSPSHAAEVLTRVTVKDWIALAVITFLMLHAAFRLTNLISSLARGRDYWRDNKIWSQLLILVGLLSLLFAAVLLTAPVLVAFIVVFVVVGLVLRAAKRFLAESLGDVQVYAERDENNEHYAAREAILDEAEKVFGLLAKRDYKEIVIIGHSLGSVIAFTALDRLHNRVPSLRRNVHALITLGTAIEKVRYFFERRTDADNQVAERLKEWAAIVSGGRAWLNLWYENDLVANPITSFDDEDAKARREKAIDVDFSAIKKQHARAEGNVDWDAALPGLIERAKRELVVNISFGYPVARFPLVWTHSRYWGDADVLGLIARVAFPTTTAITEALEPDKVQAGATTA